MKLTLEIWRQAGPDTEGHFETVEVPDAVEQMSILELLDHVNNQFVEEGKEPFTYASDCREGICGTCGLTINGRPHGADQNVPACLQRLVNYNDGDTLKIEPFRSAVFPVIKDLVVDRSALDRVMQQGGYVSVFPGHRPRRRHPVRQPPRFRACTRLRSLHRLWCLCGCVPEWRRAPVHWC